MVEDVSIPVAVLGASGYSGGELLRLAVRHRNIKNHCSFSGATRWAEPR